MVEGLPDAVEHVVAKFEPPEDTAVAVGVGAAVLVLMPVGDGVGDGVVVDDVDCVGDGAGLDVLPDVGAVDGAVDAAVVGAFEAPLAAAVGEATKPEGAVVGLSGLLPVTLPPPDEQAAAAITAEPAKRPSIKRLYIEVSRAKEIERHQRRRGEGRPDAKISANFKFD